MQTIYFTKFFTAGVLKGLTINEKVSFPTVEACVDYVRRGAKGIKKPLGGSPYKIIDWSFQSYAR